MGNATGRAPPHGPVDKGARTPPGCAPRRRAHAPGQAEGAGAEGLRGGTDACTVRHGNQLYDSTVDDVQNPSIYVTYNDSQVYPDILIKFLQ